MRIGMGPLRTATTSVAACFALAASLQGVAHGAALEVVVNPYQHVDWKSIHQYKGNLHTHTTESDGSFEPAKVIDLYHEHGYDMLAITDHNKFVWPWEAYGRSPETLGMTAVRGNELSRHHHALSLFCEYETESEDLDEALAGVAAAGGMAILCHPAMHWEGDRAQTSRLRRLLDESARPKSVPEEEVPRYVDLFKRHAHLTAVEVSNASEPLYRYPLDRQLWDKLLEALMPERPVWGVNTDDMHSLDHFGREFVVFLTEDRDASRLRQALVDGAYCFCSRRVPESAAPSSAAPPRVDAVEHDAAAHVLRATASVDGAALPDDAYAWISRGEVVHAGPALPYRETEGLGNYVRLEITAKGGTTFLNPFGFKNE